MSFFDGSFSAFNEPEPTIDSERQSNKMLTTEQVTIHRRAQLTGILEAACQALELSPSQLELAQQRYLAIGNWLSEADNTALRTSTIYPQGSIALETMVKPIGRNEHDVDLVCHVPGVGVHTPPAVLKRLIGDRLASNARYAEMLEEKPRCWRINYANEFHLDITPSIPNLQCPNGGEFVPDRKLRRWKPTNPKGYRSLFESRAALQPTILLYEARLAEVSAEVEALPGPTRFKGALRRCVQLYKRNRDVFFAARIPELAPISIIITTLAAKSYVHCVNRRSYETELDLLLDVLLNMPVFVEEIYLDGRNQYFVWNETTQGENFAEKWNIKPELAEAFFLWHRQALLDFHAPLDAEGLDEVRHRLSGWLGDDVTGKAFARINADVAAKRAAGQLAVTPLIGITSTSTGRAVRHNTFYGR